MRIIGSISRCTFTAMRYNLIVPHLATFRTPPLTFRASVLLRVAAHLAKLIDMAYQRYEELIRMIVREEVSVWHSMAFHRLLFSIQDFCESTQSACAALRESDTDP